MNSKLLHQRHGEASTLLNSSASKLGRARRVIAMVMLGTYLLTGIVSPDVFSLLSSPFSIPAASAATGINPIIHYQGKISLLAGSAVGNGSYNMRFKIYDAASGGNILWSENWTNATTRVTMTGGLFSVGLGTHVTMTGSVNFNTDNLYLQVEFDPGNDGTFEEVFAPRRRFASVPYAHNANTLDGVDSTKFVRNDNPNRQNFSGAIVFSTGGTAIRVAGAISGAIINAMNSLTTSGTLTVRGAVQFKNYTTCGIIKTDANGNLGCGSAAGTSTGNVLALGDSRYVRKSGDTMTGALTINVTGGNTSTIGLNVLNTISGAVIRAQKSLNSSGTLVFEGAGSGRSLYIGQTIRSGVSIASSGSLVWEGAASGATLYVATSINGAGLTDCDLSTQSLRWDATTGRFSCGSAGATYTAGQGLSLSAGNAFSLNSTITGALVRFTTVSGSTVFARNQLVSSGTLVTESGAYFDGTTMVIQAGSNRVGIGTASPTSALHVVSPDNSSSTVIGGFYANNETQGIVFTYQGIYNPGGFIRMQSNGNTIGIYEGSPSAQLHVQTALASRTALKLTAAASQTASMFEVLNSSLQVMSSIDKSGSGYFARALGVGTGTPGSKLAVSGAVIIGNNIGSSAAKAQLDVKGSISGSLLTLSNLRNCNLETSATGAVICGTDDGTTYYAGQGLSLNGSNSFSLNSTITGALVRFTTVSGSTVFAKNRLVSSGTLVTESGAIFDGGTMYVDAEGNRVGIGTTTPGGTLEVVGDVVFNGNNGTKIFFHEAGDTNWTLGREGTPSGAQIVDEGAHVMVVYGGGNNQGFMIRNNAGTSLFEIQGSDGLTYFAGNVGIGTTDASTKLEVVGTASGQVIYGQQSLRSSGSLVWEGAASGATLYVATSINGAGLTDCDLSTQALKWDATTGRFSCGTAGATYTAGQGLSLSAGNAFSLNTTITGALVRFTTLSGSTVYAKNSLSSSGALTWEGSASGARLHVSSLITGSGGLDIEGTINAGNRVIGRTTSTTEGGIQAYGNGSGNQEFLSLHRGSDGYEFLSFSIESGVGVLITENGAGALKLRSSNVALQDASGNNFASYVVANGWADSTTSMFNYIGAGTTALRIASTGGAYTRAAIFTQALQVTSLSGQFAAPVPRAMFEVINDTTSKIGSIVRGFTGQTADLFVVQNSNSGSLFTVGNLGQTTIFNTGSNALRVMGTISGSIIRAQKTLASSGTLVWEGAASGATLYVATSINGAGLTDCDLSTQALKWDATTGRFSCGTDTDTTYTAGQGLTLNAGNFFSLNTTITGALVRFTTVSGSTVFARNQLVSSGTLIVESGSILQQPVFITTNSGFTTSGLRLRNYITPVSSFRTSTAVFESWTQSRVNNPAFVFSSTGSTADGAWNLVEFQNKGSTKFAIDQNGGFTTQSAIMVQPHLLTRATNSSHFMHFGVSGNTGVANANMGGIYAAGTTVAASRQVVGMQWDGLEFFIMPNVRFGIGTTDPGSPLSVSGSAIIGSNITTQTADAGIALEIIGTASGRTVYAQQALASSGTLVWEGAASGATLYVATSINGAGLTDCDLSTQALKWDATTGRFSCGSISAGNWSGTGALTTAFDARYVNIAGDTMTGALTIQNGNTHSATSTALLNVRGTMSGRSLNISGTGASPLLSTRIGTSTVGINTVNPFYALTVTPTSDIGSRIQIQRIGDGTGAGDSWGFGVGRYNASDSLILGQSSSDYTSGGALSWVGNDESFLYVPGETFSVSGGVGSIPAFSVIRSTLSVGINTKTPGSKFAVSGAVIIGNNIGSNAAKAQLDVLGSISGSSLLTLSNYRNCNLETSATGAVICGTDNGTTYYAGQGLTLNGSNSFSLNTTITGALVRFTTLSGSTVFARNRLVSSGTLIVKSLTKTGSGAASFIGQEFQSGAYVYGSGAAMLALDSYGPSGNGKHILFGYRGNFDTNLFRSGAATLRTDGSFYIGNGLTIIGSTSGSIIHAEKTLSSSGTLVWEGAASGASLYVATSIRGSGLVDCDIAGTSKLLWDSTTGRFSCGTDTDTDTNTTYTAGRGLGLNGTVFSLNSTITGALVSFTTVSGSVVKAKNTLASSGSLTWEGAGSGASLYIGGTFEGAGLTDCDLSTQVLKWDATTKRFSCGTVAATFGSGNVVALGDARYVRRSGGTMTGALTINVTGGNNSTIGLNVMNTISGSVIRAQKTLASSGSLVWEGAASGATLYVATSIRGAGLTDCDLSTQVLKWDTTTGRFSCGAATNFGSGNVVALGDTRYVRKSGDTMTGGLTIQNGNTHTATSTALLNVRGTMSGRSLNVSGTGGSPVLFTLLNKSYVGIGTSNPLAKLHISGGNLRVNGTEAVMEALAGGQQWDIGIRSNGMYFVRNVTNNKNIFLIEAGADDNSLYIDSTGFVGLGTASPETKLEVLGTMSGQSIYISGTGSSPVLMNKGGFVGMGTATPGAALHVVSGANQGTTIFERTGVNGAGAAFPFVMRTDGQTVGDFIGLRFEGKDSTGGIQNYGGIRVGIQNATNGFEDSSLDFVTFENGASNARLVISGSLVGIGTLAPKTKLEVAGTISGSNLTISNLRNCDTIDTDANGVLTCGTDQNAAAGLDLNTADARYVRRSGGSMTGALSISVTGGNNATVALNVLNTISGSVIRAQKTLASSGSLVWEGAASGATLYVATSFQGAGLTDCDLSTQSLRWDATTGRFSCGSAGATYTAGQGLSLSAGNAFSLNTTITGALVRFTTVSGSTVFARNLLASSGTLVTESGAYLDGGTFVLQAGSNRIGLGTSTPEAQLHFYDADLTEGNGVFIEAFNAELVEGVHQYALTVSNTANPLVNAEGLTVAASFQAKTAVGNKVNFTNGAELIGGVLGASHNGQGYYELITGEKAHVYNAGTGSVGTVIGDWVNFGGNYTGTASGAITNAYGIWLNGVNDSSGTIGVMEGAHIRLTNDSTRAIGVGAAINILALTGSFTSKFGIYQQGREDVNYFAGKLGLGTTTPNANSKLDIIGGRLRSSGYASNTGYLLTNSANLSSQTNLNPGIAFFGGDNSNALYGADLGYNSTTSRYRTRLFSGQTNTDVALGVQTDSPALTQASFSEKMTIRGDSGNVGIGTASPGSKLAVSGAVIISNNAGSVAADAGLMLEVVGTASGRILKAMNTLASSGSLVWEGAASGASLYIGGTIEGAGLVGDCDGDGQTLGWDATTKRFTCGTDESAGSGLDINSADARYVNTSGDSMTGALVINVTGGNNSTIGLNVLNTISGSVIRAQKTLASSGTLVWEGAGSGDSLYIDGNIGIGKANPTTRVTVFGTDPGAGTYSLGYRVENSATNAISMAIAGSRGAIGSTNATALDFITTNAVRMSIGTTGNIGIGNVTSPGSRLSVSGAVVIGNNLGSIAADSGIELEVLGTASGRVVFAQQSLRSSGSLVWEGAASGATLYLGGKLEGAGLTDCDTAGSSKLLWDATTGRFSCGTDQTGGVGGSNFGSGNVVALGDARYVRRSGGTMTGALTINVTGGNNSTLGLNVMNTISGSVISAQKSLASSGILVVEGATNLNGTTTIGISGTPVALIMGGNGTNNSYIQLRASESTFGSYGLDYGATLDATRLYTYTGRKLSIGSFTFNRATYTSRMLMDDSTGHFGFGTITPGSRMSISGATIIGTNVGSAAADANIALEVLGTASGQILFAQQSLRSSGSLVWEGVGSGSSLSLAGGNLTWSRSGAIVYNEFGKNVDVRMEGDTNAALFYLDASTDRIGLGKVDPKVRLDVLGTISGSLITQHGAGNNFFQGNVGIGKSPTTKLEVAGTISGSAITQNGGTSYFLGTLGVGLTNPASMSTPSLMVIRSTTAVGSSRAQLALMDSSSAAQGVGGFLTFGGNYIGDSQNYTWAGIQGYKEQASGGSCSTCGSLVFYTKATSAISEKMRITSNGYVGIGTTTPRSTLHVIGSGAFIGTLSGSKITSNSFASSGGLVIESLIKAGSGATTIVGAEFQTGAYVYSSGATALALDSYVGSGAKAPNILFGYRGNFDTALYRFGTAGSGGLVLRTTSARASTTAFQIVSQVNQTDNKVFRVTASGGVYADSKFNSNGADYAEWFRYSGTKPVEGEVVCIDVTKKNTIKRCAGDADSNVMGIVSTNPAFVGNVITGAEGIMPPGYALIGLIGQVPAKVKIENNEAIRPGDALTAGSTPGYARKARAGESTVGVALEPLAKGEGVVNVLISRRNQSLTVEAVEEKVLKTIASMEIEDEVQLMVSSALGDLNVDQQITDEVSRQIDAITQNQQSIEAIQAEIAYLKTELARIKSQTGTTTTVVTQSGSSHLAASTLELDSTLATGGDARIGGDLYIDGALNASSLFVPNGLTIDGGVVMNGLLSAAQLNISSGATVNGVLTINGTLNLASGATIDLGSGALTISQLIVENALYVMGDITIKGLATFLGDINVKGELIVSNNQAGFAMIPQSGTSVTIFFGTGFKATPVVTATPQGRVGAEWWVQNSSSTGFTIAIDGIATQDVLFAWHALSTGTPVTTHAQVTSDGTIIFPMASDNIPVSSNMAWNACIRNLTMLDDQGLPLSCARYHDNYTWTHPDLNISFIWNTSTTPPILKIPDGYTVEVTENAQTIIDAIRGLEEETDPVEETSTGSVIEEPATETGTVIEDPAAETGAVIEEPVEETPIEEVVIEPVVEEEPVEEEPAVEESAPEEIPVVETPVTVETPTPTEE